MRVATLIKRSTSFDKCGHTHLYFFSTSRFLQADFIVASYRKIDVNKNKHAMTFALF